MGPSPMCPDTADRAGTVALLPFGDVMEDWSASLSLSAQEIAEQGWIAGFIDCLTRARIRTVLVLVSEHASRPRRVPLRQPGAVAWLLPQPRSAAVARRCIVESQRLPVRLWNAPFRRAKPYLSTPVRSLTAVLRQERCSAIVCQEYEYARFDVCVGLGRRLRIPVFATFQGYKRWFRPFTSIEGLIRPLTVRRADGFIVASDVEAHRITRRYGVREDRIAQIGNPVDTRYWRAVGKAAARCELGIDPDALVVAWHGRVEICRRASISSSLPGGKWPQTAVQARGSCGSPAPAATRRGCDHSSMSSIRAASTGAPSLCRIATGCGRS